MAGWAEGSARPTGRSRPELLESRQLLAIDVSVSTFDATLMGDAIKYLAAGSSVGYAYAVNDDGQSNAVSGGGGLARTSYDQPVRAFNANVEFEVATVTHPITATAVLHFLQSLPGGLDAALKTKLIDYLPSDWTPGPNIKYITLRHLLAHTSGLSETNNAITVNFENYANHTFANLKSLIQAGLPAPNVPTDTVYGGPRWNLADNFNTANFTLLARVVLPKLINPSLDLTESAYPGQRDAVSGSLYAKYVREQIFEPLGIVGADLVGNDSNPAKGYNLGVNAAGAPLVDYSSLGGAFGWKLSARELAIFLNGIQRNNILLLASTRALRDAQQLGWIRIADPFGDSYGHSGAVSVSAGRFRTRVDAFPGGIEASFLMNSDDVNLSTGAIGSLLRKAYVNGWTNLTVVGTPAADTIELTTLTDSGKPAIRVTLNGVVQFTRWVESLQSVTINADSGDDMILVSDWKSSVHLEVNGQGGNDSLQLLQPVGNIELVSGMVFDGGGGSDRLLIFDQSNPYSISVLGQTYAVSNTSVHRHRGALVPNSGFTAIPVVVDFLQVEALELTTGDRGDTVQLASKVSGATRIFTGPGDDLVVVGQVDADLELFDGLSIDGATGNDTVQLFDQNRTIGAAQLAWYDVDSDSVSRYVSDVSGGNAVLPAEAVSFTGVENLSLTTTSGNDRLRVAATTSATTTIQSGNGDDLLTAVSVDKNLELVNDLIFHGGPGIDALVLNDQKNPYSRPVVSGTYLVTADQVSRSMAAGNGSAPVKVAFSGVDSLSLYTGDQADVVSVASTVSGQTLIDTGKGDDTIEASSATRNLESVNHLTVNGGAGVDELTVQDSANPYGLGSASGDYAVTPSGVSRLSEDPAHGDQAVVVEVAYLAVESIAVNTGRQADVVTVTGAGGPASLLLDGNGGNDQFRILSAAFATMRVQGDSPTLAPGDLLVVNPDGTLRTVVIPGEYGAGAGGVAFGASQIFYEGVESVDVFWNSGLLGDLDGDLDVDAGDMLTFLANWTSSLVPGTGDKNRSTGDLDGDADVDAGDLLELLAAWTGSVSF